MGNHAKGAKLVEGEGNRCVIPGHSLGEESSLFVRRRTPVGS